MLLKILKTGDKEKVKLYIDKLPEGKKYNVDVKLRREIRSFSQNRLYWLWLTCIMVETGNDKDWLHRFFGEKYLPVDQRLVFGKPINKPVSTHYIRHKTIQVLPRPDSAVCKL